jgi:hypothetical protein
MFKIYSNRHRLLGTVGTLPEAELRLAEWEQGSYIVEGHKIVARKPKSKPQPKEELPNASSNRGKKR